MDAFAHRLTARGPTLSADRTAWTGSLHVVDVPDAAAARAFALNEPYHRAGLFSGHLISRFDNLLGRTMWDLSRQAGDVPFLILAGGGDAVPAAATLQAQLPPPVAVRLALWGTLTPTHDVPERATGMAVAILAPDETVVRTVLAAEPVLLGGCLHRQLHAWEFGGRC